LDVATSDTQNRVVLTEDGDIRSTGTKNTVPKALGSGAELGASD